MSRLLCLIGLHRWRSITYGYFDRCDRCGKLRVWYER